MATQIDQVHAGWSVHDREGEKIGDIEEVGQNYLLVTKGLIFTSDVYVPVAEVDEIDADEGHVFLRIAKADVDAMGWTDPPTAAAAESGSAESVGGLGYTGRDTADDSTAAFGGATTDETVEGVGYTGAETTADRVSVPVHEEELQARRTRESASDTMGRGRVDVEEAGGVLAGAGASSISGAGDEMRDTGVSGMRRSTFDDDDATEAGGAAAGAVGGAAVGGVVGGPPGAVIGGAIGAAGGAVAGDKVDDESDDRDDLSGR